MNLNKRIQGTLNIINIICVVLIVAVLAVIYLPKVAFYYNDLPQLESWEQVGTSDVVLTLPEAFESSVCKTVRLWK